jgi:hypothetical protein
MRGRAAPTATVVPDAPGGSARAAYRRTILRRNTDCPTRMRAK